MPLETPRQGLHLHGSAATEPGSEPAVDEGQMISDLGSEIAAPLTAAIERLDQLRESGKIDKAGLAELRAQVERARQAGMIGQRLGRLTCGRIHQAAEVQDLTRLVREAVDQCAQVIAERGLEVREILKPADVMVDTALAFSLVQALVQWGVEHAHARVDFSVDLRTWPVRARLSCRFAHMPEDLVGLALSEQYPRLDTMTWHLVQQTALAMGLPLQREVTAGHTRVVIEFPHTVNEPIRGVSVVEIDDSDAGFALDSGTLVGSQVLVIAARREIRALVRDALRSMGLLVDFVGSVEDARTYCVDGLPHAIIYESALAGGLFDQWQVELRTAQAPLGFIEIGGTGRDYETIVRGGQPVTRIGRDAIPSALAPALGSELGKALTG